MPFEDTYNLCICLNNIYVILHKYKYLHKYNNNNNNTIFTYVYEFRRKICKC